jgi:hypothetical protein
MVEKKADKMARGIDTQIYTVINIKIDKTIDKWNYYLLLRGYMHCEVQSDVFYS